jgi:hypothetical protein
VNFQRIFTVEIIMAEEIPFLLIADPVVDQYFPVTVDYQQASHRPVAKVVLIGRIYFRPQGFRHYAEHGAAVEFEIAGLYAV